MARIVIATPLETELSRKIAEDLPAHEVVHEPALLPPARYSSDHRGDPGFRRGPREERRWRHLLAATEISFGIPGDEPDGLRRLVDGAPGLFLVQATSAGAGQQVAAAGLSGQELERVAVVSSSGVHAGPLAEFALLGILAFTRDLRRLDADRAARRWVHHATPDLDARTAVVLGTGAIGSRTAIGLKALGMRVVGVNTSGQAPPGSPFDQITTADSLVDLSQTADVLVVTLPETPATTGVVSRDVLESLPQDAVLVNVGRGRVLDEAALIDRLRSGQLAGAALDVTAAEPPAPSSPLWELPNVLLSPHTAALSPRENERIVALFVDNVRRCEEGVPIRNRITTARSY